MVGHSALFFLQRWMVMSSKLVIFCSLLLAGTVVPLSDTAYAGNLNTSGVMCQNFNASQALDIDYLSNAVRNINPSARPVICSIPRSPLSVNASPQFFVDGHNNANTCTSCTVTMYHFTGVVAESQSFSHCAPAESSSNWDHLLTFPALLGPDTFDYASMLCTLPGNGEGLIFGVTALQP